MSLLNTSPLLAIAFSKVSAVLIMDCLKIPLQKILLNSLKLIMVSLSKIPISVSRAYLTLSLSSASPSFTKNYRIGFRGSSEMNPVSSLRQQFCVCFCQILMIVSSCSYIENYFDLSSDYGFTVAAVAFKFTDLSVLVGLTSSRTIVGFRFNEFPAILSFGGPLSLSYSTVCGSIIASWLVSLQVCVFLKVLFCRPSQYYLCTIIQLLGFKPLVSSYSRSNSAKFSFSSRTLSRGNSTKAFCSLSRIESEKFLTTYPFFFCEAVLCFPYPKRTLVLLPPYELDADSFVSMG